MNSPGVGVCLTFDEAVLAVVRPDPLRLAALASVDLPAELWAGGAAPVRALSAACRSLVRVRRRLRLPRWSPLAVVLDPALPAGDVLPGSAVLLARAGLAQGWVVTAGRAATLLATVEVRIDARLTPAAADHRVGYAIGAALATFQPADHGAAEPVQAMPRAPEPAYTMPRAAEPVRAMPLAAEDGWAVQRVGPDDAFDEPSGASAANHGWLTRS
ncbi:hypothetical protein [Phytohabitans rumicis]|uniref:Uncharacterized protein n=1 Tax=Phytohabitans rumicis TaxID=1076125 RepID=A0A6V8L1X5_9ACTN|nr:hypothetical protein [Phytohabitans rumicis]GFJ86715.1 hypothetical protein Prum_003570 [Phytohabitans rumicis]